LTEGNQTHAGTGNNNRRRQQESLFSMFQIPWDLSPRVLQVALILLLGDNRIFSPENNFLTKCFRMDLKASMDSQGLNVIPGLAT
jgi:hypothetical protein